MTRNNSSTLESFDLEIERTLRRLHNLVEEKVSPKKEGPTMEETRVLGVANITGAGNGAANIAAWRCSRSCSWSFRGRKS